MPGFASYDEIIAALTTTGRSQDLVFQKPSITAVANFWYSLWAAAGMPSAGASPASVTGRQCTDALAGAMPFVNPTSPRTMHMLNAGVGGQTQGTLLLYDRLWDANISLASATSQAISGGTQVIPRYATGEGNILMVEVAAAGGSTASNLTVTYTNQAGTGSRVTVAKAVGGTQPVNRMYMLDLASGDYGVRSVQSAILSASTTAGTANIIIAKPIAYIPWLAGQYSERDLVLQVASLPKIFDDACLAMAILATATSTGLMFGKLKIAEN